MFECTRIMDKHQNERNIKSLLLLLFTASLPSSLSLSFFVLSTLRIYVYIVIWSARNQIELYIHITEDLTHSHMYIWCTYTFIARYYVLIHQEQAWWFFLTHSHGCVKICCRWILVVLVEFFSILSCFLSDYYYYLCLCVCLVLVSFRSQWNVQQS